MTQKLKFIFLKVELVVGKGGKILVTTISSKAPFSVLLKARIAWQSINSLPHNLDFNESENGGY